MHTERSGFDPASQKSTISVIMKRVSVSQLKAKLSAYLEEVRAGTEVVVTDHGRPVAQLRRVEEPASASQLRARLISEGVLSPRKRKLDDAFFEAGGSRGEAKVVDALLEERESGR